MRNITKLTITWCPYSSLWFWMLWCCSSRLRIRSANLIRLTVPRCRLTTYGCWAFYHSCPTVWNSLPDELRNYDSFHGFKQRRRFPPGSCVLTRPLLRSVGSIPLVDPTKFWEGTGDAHIRQRRCLHIWQRFKRECHVSNRLATSRRKILQTKIQSNALYPGPAWGAYSAPQTPSWIWGGWAKGI